MISHGNITHAVLGVMVHSLEIAKILEACIQRYFLSLLKPFASHQYGTHLIGFQ